MYRCIIGAWEEDVEAALWRISLSARLGIFLFDDLIRRFFRVAVHWYWPRRAPIVEMGVMESRAVHRLNALESIEGAWLVDLAHLQELDSVLL